MYPPDENIAVKITMGASAGFGHNGNTRGRGGVTVFTYTLQKNTEYVFKLGTTVSPPTSLGYGGAGVFFYEKGRLLVACGGGGASVNVAMDGDVEVVVLSDVDVVVSLTVMLLYMLTLMLTLLVLLLLVERL